MTVPTPAAIIRATARIGDNLMKLTALKSLRHPVIDGNLDITEQPLAPRRKACPVCRIESEHGTVEPAYEGPNAI